MKVSPSRLLAIAIVTFLPGVAAAQISSVYKDFAAVVSEPIFDVKSAQTAKQAYTDGGVMARKESERQRFDLLVQSKDWLLGGPPVPGLELYSPISTLKSTQETISRSLFSCYSTLSEIRRLDSSTPDYEGLVKQAIDAAPAGYKVYKKETLGVEDKKEVTELAVKAVWEIGGAVVNAYNLSTERDKYARSYRTSRLETEKAMSYLATLHANWGTAKPGANTAVVVAGINPSLANTYINDIIELRNDSGKVLTACSLFVKLSGINAGTGAKETDSHFHFVSQWPAGESRYLWYPSKSKTGVATNESVDVITDVDVDVGCDELKTTASFKFTGKKYDDYVKEWANKYLSPEDFTGRWYDDDDNVIDPAGFSVTYSGKMPSFNVKGIYVKAINGTRSETIRHSKTYWKSAETKWICHKNFNSVYPKTVEVVIKFPGTNYEHVTSWEFTPSRGSWSFPLK